jgi:transcriptional regulator of acetoin/glycerol metabolism
MTKGNNEVARDLRAKWRIDPSGARADVLRVVDACQGDATRAAKLLGIGRRTLNRYLSEDKLLRAADKETRAKRREMEAT